MNIHVLIKKFIIGRRLIDKTKITTLRELTKTVPRFAKIQSKTLKLLGHINRSNLGLSKLCLEGNVQGKKNRGTPRAGDGGTYSFPGPLSITGPGLTNKRKTVGFGNTSVMLVSNLPQAEIAFHDNVRAYPLIT